MTQGKKLNLQNASFFRSAASPADFPRDMLPQIVFAGKSNVGKSSVINCLLRRKNFARVGGEPGKTIHVNYFNIDGRIYFVDLPGYGYAKVSQAEKDRWAKLLEAYFAQSDRIAFGLLLVDARHAPGENDKLMADLFRRSGRPFAVVANKLDKLRPGEIEGSLRALREGLSLEESVPLVPFSAEKGTGREELLRLIPGVGQETAPA